MDRKQQRKANCQKWFQKNHLFKGGKDPEFQRIVESFFCGEILEYGALTDIQRALILLATLTASQTIKPLRHYTTAALTVGTPPEAIKEAIYQCTPYIGIERVQAALDEINAAFSAAGLSRNLKAQGNVTEDTRQEAGKSIQEKLFEPQMLAHILNDIPDNMKSFGSYWTAFCCGDFYSRSALDLATRELLAFCAAASLGVSNYSLQLHAAANIRLGTSRDTLIAAVMQCLPFIGFPRASQALYCIREVTE